MRMPQSLFQTACRIAIRAGAPASGIARHAADGTGTDIWNLAVKNAVLNSRL